MQPMITRVTLYGLHCNMIYPW